MSTPPKEVQKTINKQYKKTKQMTKKFKTLPKIQSLQLVRNANRILLNKYESFNNTDELSEEQAELLDLRYNDYEASEIALSQYLNQ